MKIFISYSHKDKELAGNMKVLLHQEFKFDVFLAHEDIKPTRVWENEILSELRLCDVLILIISEHYYNSEWTDQEVGFALGRDVLIIPVKVNADPRGFLKKYQALSYRKVEKTCKPILKPIVENENLREAILNLLIRNFGLSYNFDKAGENIETLLEFDRYLSTGQKNEILSLAKINNQITGSSWAKSKLRVFINEYKEELEEEIVARYQKSI